MSSVISVRVAEGARTLVKRKGRVLQDAESQSLATLASDAVEGLENVSVTCVQVSTLYMPHFPHPHPPHICRFSIK